MNPWRGFLVAVAACSSIALLGLVRPDALQRGALDAVAFVLRWLDWFYLAVIGAFVIMAGWLALGRHGHRRLGPENEPPEFSRRAWWAMLFSAGIGSGLMFWGVAEPLTHFAAPPFAMPRSPEAARHALVLCDFHWGIHAWAIYCVAALSLAWFHFRDDRDLLPGAPLRGAFDGAYVEPLARVCDVIGMLAVAFGVAGAMGMGVLQMRSGLATLTGIDPSSTVLALCILAALAVAYMISAAGKIDHGIKWLSAINVGLATAFFLALFVLGPTTAIARAVAGSAFDYAAAIVPLSLQWDPWSTSRAWLHEWTLGYMIWWIAWAPFVGVFVARISRGRRVREFVAGVVLVPTLVSIVWFATLGTTAIDLEGGGAELTSLLDEDVSRVLFALLARLPWTSVSSTIAIVLVFVFLVTSVDSACYVLGMMTSRGVDDPPRARRLIWGVVLTLLAAALVLTRHVGVVKAVAIFGAIPFTLVLLAQCVAFLRSLAATK